MSNSAYLLRASSALRGWENSHIEGPLYYRKPTIVTGCVRLDHCSVSERKFCLWQPISCRNDDTDGLCAMHVWFQCQVLSLRDLTCPHYTSAWSILILVYWTLISNAGTWAGLGFEPRYPWYQELPSQWVQKWKWSSEYEHRAEALTEWRKELKKRRQNGWWETLPTTDRQWNRLLPVKTNFYCVTHEKYIYIETNENIYTYIFFH